MEIGNRKFAFRTIGDLQKDLRDMGLPISKTTIIRQEQLGLYKFPRSIGGWRVITPSIEDKIKRLLWRNYMGDEPFPGDKKEKNEQEKSE